MVDAEVKPLLRGVSHEIAAGLALAGAILLVAFAPAGKPQVGALIYGVSLCGLFLTSALYHRAPWKPTAKAVMRRIDHSAIFVLIAGTYTPFCLLLDPAMGRALFGFAWGGAALGVARVLLWPGAPRFISAALYVLLGWTVLPVVGSVAAQVGLLGLGLLLTGGLAYTVGAVIYALQRPDPFPTVFGYHEIFHALVVGAAACHYAVVAMSLHV